MDCLMSGDFPVVKREDSGLTNPFRRLHRPTVTGSLSVQLGITKLKEARP